VAGEKAGEFHSFTKDIESVGDFIRLYSTRYKRWTSPKFLIGESYGTTRAAGLSGYLQERHGMYLNGVMLVSCILNFLTARFGPGNDAPYILFLPTYAATAWYHGKVKDKWNGNLEGFLKEVEEFAAGKYASGLFQGDALPEKERTSLVRKLSEYTGLSQAYIEQTNLRVDIHRFNKELLRDEHRTVGRLDSRFKGIDRDSAGEHGEFDPSMMDILGPYTAAMYDYVRNDLAFESDIPYEILSFKVNRNWSYASHENEYVNVAETLRRAMSVNPYLKVFVANGYYDLATPYFATIHTFNHLGLDKELRGNISMGFYEAGHMMYVQLESLKKLKGDLANFVNNALPS
jgi:carboxypeptidase C (cathepsin A)